MIFIGRELALFLLLILLQLSISQPATACSQGMTWGMDISAVEQQLGVSLEGIDKASEQKLFEAHDLQIGLLPVSRLRLHFAETKGLQHLAYELDPEAMTEVLAGLRHRYGPPVSTTLDDSARGSKQQWIWHTGDDVITAISSGNQPFLLAYRPCRLDPNLL